MVSRLLAFVAVIAGGLIGLQAAPAVWSALVQAGIVATPACHDGFGVSVNAMCVRPQSMEVVALAMAALCATAAGIVVRRLIRAGVASPSEHDATE